MIPEIYAEIHLIFDNDFDVNRITKMTGIQPTECCIRNNTWINPITNQHNPGYWTLKSKTISHYDASYAIESLLALFTPKLETIRSICLENDGEVRFDIIPSFGNNNMPSIFLDRDFLKIVNYLNATIELDMYPLD